MYVTVINYGEYSQMNPLHFSKTNLALYIWGRQSIQTFQKLTQSRIKNTVY